MYRKEGGAFPDPILNLTWNYTDPDEPDPEELAKEMNGRALVDLKDADGAVVRAPARCWMASPNCATTAPPRPAAGSSRAVSPRRATRWPAATRPTRATRASRRTGPGRGRPTGASSTTAPAPISRARRGTRRSRSSSGTASSWVGIDVPDYGPTTKPSDGGRPVHHERRRRRAAVRPRPDGRRPVPRTLRAVRNARRRTCCTRRCRTTRRRACSPTTGRRSAPRADFPYVATTYRLTEHFHFWTKHALINAILQPEEFIEIGEALAKEKGIEQGGWVRVVLEARRGRLQGLCDQAHRPADGRRQADACDRRAPSIGASPARRARATAPTR